MTKKILALLFFFHVFAFFANAQQEINFTSQLKNEIRSFIDTVKPKTIKNGKYNVYVAKFNQTCSVTECASSITFGYIQNDYDLKYTYFNYYFTLDSELVLVYVPDSAVLRKLADFNLSKVDKNNVIEILKRVCDSKYESITSRRKGEILCFKEDKFIKVYYPDTDMIPKECSIYNVNKIMEGSEIREIPYPELSPEDSINK